MPSFRTLAAALLASAGLAGIAPADDRPLGPPAPPPSYGPWWLNQSNTRPTRRPEKVERDETAVGVGDVAAPLGVQVWVWGDVADLKPGNRYELRYQIRVHTRKGEAGPLLGTAAMPNGTALPLASAVAGPDWNGLEAAVDVTRKDLTAMTRLPKPGRDKESHAVFLRVEPQLYDVAGQKYLTPVKSSAVVLVARMWADGKVGEVTPLADWLMTNRGDTADTALAALADLDAYDPTANGVERAIERVLDMTDVPAATKAKYVAVIPADRLNRKACFNLKRTLEKYADGTDEALKAAAGRKLAEAK